MAKSTMSRATSTSLFDEEHDQLFQRVTKSFLRSVTKDPLGSITFLDLTCCGLKRITGLSACPNIEIVIANNNEIDTLVDLSGCRHLWKLDVSCNELKDLCGFEKFRTFGSLIASCNHLNWPELVKISHLEVLSLCLTGNRKLERDCNYRKHVIKCLPKVWALDGELVTSEERHKIHYFFEKTAKSKRPVRLKIPSHHFVPSFRKHGSDVTIYGKRTADLCKYFARNELHNSALDSKRLQYLCKNFHADFVLESCNEPAHDFLKDCFAMRENSAEKSNMFLLLLISSLVFSIPTALMISVLQVVGMTEFEIANCDTILNLPCQLRTNLTSLLFSLIKLHGLAKGISTQLYDTLRSLNNCLIKVAYGDKDVEILAKHQHILAAELVQIFCLVPHFSSYLSDSNVIGILVSATLNNCIEEELEKLLCKCETYQAKENLVEFITLKIREAKESSLFTYGEYFKEAELRSSKSISAFPFDIRDSGRARPATAPPTLSRYNHKMVPSVGDKILMGPQRLGHIVSNPDVRVVLVQVDSLSSARYLQADYTEPTNNKQSLFYVKKDDLEWNESFKSWVFNATYPPTKTVSDMKKSDVLRRRLNNVNIVLHREPSQVIQRSKATAEKMPIKVSSFRSSRSPLPPKSTGRFSRLGRSMQEDHEEQTKNLKDLNGTHAGDDDSEPSAKPAELIPDEVADDYLPVLQSNAYHLYYVDKTRYSTPIVKFPMQSQSIDVRRSNSSFIRRSNWMRPMT